MQKEIKKWRWSKSKLSWTGLRNEKRRNIWRKFKSYRPEFIISPVHQFLYLYSRSSVTRHPLYYSYIIAYIISVILSNMTSAAPSFSQRKAQRRSCLKGLHNFISFCSSSGESNLYRPCVHLRVVEQPTGMNRAYRFLKFKLWKSWNERNKLFQKFLQQTETYFPKEK